MSTFDNIGRINKKALLVSNSVLFGICVICILIRYYVRLLVQKQFSVDDGILIFGVLCLIAAMVLLFLCVDNLYLMEALEGNTIPDDLPIDFLSRVLHFERYVTGALVLTWCVIVCVKLSYLFLFRKLIDRLRPMRIYWWSALTFNVLISIYGLIIYGAVRPWYCTSTSVQCLNGSGLDRSLAFAISQMVLDIFGDLLILVIPFHLIWRVKVRWTQKLVLASTLCLTILTIMCTITRVAGFITANLALTMTAATAFRTFFVSRHHAKPDGKLKSHESWFTGRWRLLKLVLSPWSWSSKSGGMKMPDNPDDRTLEELPYIEERATMTGMRTFINNQGD